MKNHRVLSTYGMLPSLTVERAKNVYKPSKYGHCRHFLFRNDMCYITDLLI